MQTDVTWHARVGIVYALKSLPKIKLNIKKLSKLIQHLSSNFTNAQHVLDRILIE